MVEHIGTELMIADPQTKALPIEVFKRHVVSMCLVDSFDVVDQCEFSHYVTRTMRMLDPTLGMQVTHKVNLGITI